MRPIVFLIALAALASFPVTAQDAPAAPTDPVRVAPEHYRVLLDNEQVRVLDQRLPPKASERRHYHPARVTVHLDDQLSRVTLDGGVVVERETKAGQALWREAEYHELTHLGDKPAHNIVVEMKRGAGDMSLLAAWGRDAATRPVDRIAPDVQRMALLGSRDAAGSFIERLRYPHGHLSQPQRHSAELHALVLTGRLCLGYGERFERASAQCHGPGTLLVIQPNLPHYQWVEGETVLQIEAMGPMRTLAAGAATEGTAAVSSPQAATGAPRAASLSATSPPPSAAAPSTRLPAAAAPVKPSETPAPAAPAATRAPADLPHLRTRDYDFYFEEHGKGSPLVLVHGGLGDYRVFGAVVNQLARNHRVIAYSRRFHHPNGAPPSGEMKANDVDDLLAVMDALDARRPDVIGHGAGAAIVLAAAADHPDRFQRLILAEPDAPGLMPDAKVAQALSERERAFHAQAEKHWQAGERTPALRVLVDDWLGAGGFDRASADWRQLWEDNGHTIALGPQSTAGVNCELVARVAAPALVLRGGNSASARQAMARAVERCLKRAEGMEIADAGYLLFRDQPATVVAAIELFLKTP